MTHARRRVWVGVGAAIAALGVPAAHAQPAPQAPPRGVPAATLQSGTLSFDGHATVGDFVGKTTTVSGAVAASPDAASARGWVEAPVATLRTGNGRRDRDMRKVMEVEKYPTMRYELAGLTIQPAAGRADSAGALLHGTLSLHGVSRRVDVPVGISRVADTLRVTGTFPVNVTDYRVGGLSRMGGLLRMRERIEVHLALRFVAAEHADRVGRAQRW